jgi:hypothetical protein
LAEVRWQTTAAIAHPGLLNLHHFGAKIPEDLRAIGASENLGEIEHSDTA